MPPTIQKIHTDLNNVFSSSIEDFNAFKNKEHKKESFKQIFQNAMHFRDQIEGYIIYKNIEGESSPELSKKETLINELSNKTKKQANSLNIVKTFDDFKNTCNKAMIQNDKNYLSEATNVFKAEIKKCLRQNEVNSNDVEKTLRKYANQYADTIFDFNREGGKGYYDFYSTYKIERKSHYETFIKGIEKLQEKGYDILMPYNKKDEKQNSWDVILVSNSGNVTAIQNIIFKECNFNHFMIEGRIGLPKIGQEMDISFIDKISSLKDSNEIKQHFGKKSKYMPDFMAEQFIAHVDASGAGRLQPYKSLIAGNQAIGKYLKDNEIRSGAIFTNSFGAKFGSVKQYLAMQPKEDNIPESEKVALNIRRRSRKI